MEHKTFDDIRRVATVSPIETRVMSRRERLERWARLLEQSPSQWLSPLRRVEFMPKHESAALRCDNSPLSVAFADPVLREEGLASDRYGDIRAFFDLSSRQAHYLLCDCYYQGAMTSGMVAHRIRSIVNKVTMLELWNGLCARVRTAWAGAS